MAVEYLAEKQHISLSLSFQAYQGMGIIGGKPVHLILPQTWMNQMGVVVGELVRHAALETRELVIVYDDLDLPFGTLRFKTRGGAGGHNGIRSLLSGLETDEFSRLKIGIDRPPTGVEVVDYVLTPFSSAECSELPKIFERTADALETLARDGVEQAMNQFHTRRNPGDIA